jgi:hypothetical protein
MRAWIRFFIDSNQPGGRQTSHSIVTAAEVSDTRPTSDPGGQQKPDQGDTVGYIKIYFQPVLR